MGTPPSQDAPFGKDVLADAPVFERATREGNQIALAFSNAGDGLAIKGNTVDALEVAAEGVPIEFSASVIGDQLILNLDTIPEGELLVRFAQRSWHCINLVNSADIPALPFEVRC